MTTSNSSSSSRSSLSTVPAEIHLSISDHLEYLQDVNSLARTNRFFFSVLNSYIYSRISLSISDPTTMFHERRSTVLHKVAEKGMHAALRGLLQAGIPSDPVTQIYQHPIMIAAANDHAETVQVFIDHGIDPNPPTGFELRREHFGNPLTEAVRHGSLSVVKLLIEHGVDLEFGNETAFVLQPLYQAVKQGHIEIVKLLLDQGVSPMTPNYYPDEETEAGDRVLTVDNTVYVTDESVFAAAALRSMEMLELVLSKTENPDSVSLGTFDGLLPAAPIQKFDLPLLKQLWKYVLPIDQQLSEWSEQKRMVPRFHERDIFAQFTWKARHHKGRDMALFLLDKIDVDMVLECPYIRPVVCLLLGAASLNDTKLMSRLLNVNLELKEPHAKGKWRDVLTTVLEWSTPQQGHISAAKLLLDHGADPEGKTHKGALVSLTRIYLQAIQNNHLEFAGMLLDRGAPPFGEHTPGPFIQTTRWSSFDYGENLETLEFLIERNIVTQTNKDDPQYHALIRHAAQKGEAVLDRILQYTGITLDPENPYHQRGMAAAIAEGDVSLLKRFLQAGFDPDYITSEDNKRDESNRWGDLSCLINAAMSPNGEEMMDLLLEYGADPNLRFGTSKAPPLFIVPLMMEWTPDKCVDTVRLLLKKGADPLQPKGDGDSFFYRFVGGEEPAIVECILQSFNERGIDLETVESVMKQARLVAKDWDIVKLMCRWYWPKVYPCP